jgi:hypothetical protein
LRPPGREGGLVRFLRFLQLEEETNVGGRSCDSDTVSEEGSQDSEPSLVHRLEADEIQAHERRQLRDHPLELHHRVCIQAPIDRHDLP